MSSRREERAATCRNFLRLHEVSRAPGLFVARRNPTTEEGRVDHRKSWIIRSTDSQGDSASAAIPGTPVTDIESTHHKKPHAHRQEGE